MFTSRSYLIIVASIAAFFVVAAITIAVGACKGWASQGEALSGGAVAAAVRASRSFLSERRRDTGFGQPERDTAGENHLCDDLAGSY